MPSITATHVARYLNGEITDAELWILDEPFTSLDVHGIELIEQLLDAHTSAGGMLAVTSHHVVKLDSNRVQRINLSV